LQTGPGHDPLGRHNCITASGTKAAALATVAVDDARRAPSQKDLCHLVS